MTRSTILSALALGLVVGGGVGTASAEECECDCYFSNDCPPGMFCNYGNLSIEDSCWWRTPKPQGQVGVGCGDDFGDWGQCDGRCSSSASPGQAMGNETPAMVLAGIEAWADAMLSAGLQGGGVLSNRDITDIVMMPFNEIDMPYTLWRTTSEMLVLATGAEALQFPQQSPYRFEEVGVTRMNDAQATNFRLIIDALKAEITEIGTGRDFIDQVNLNALDRDLFELICTNDDVRECLYIRVQDIGLYIGIALENAGSPLAGGGPVCGGCIGDVDPNDAVDFSDILSIISGWGQAIPDLDLDQSGIVDFSDLLMALTNYGECAP